MKIVSRKITPQGRIEQMGSVPLARAILAHAGIGAAAPSVAGAGTIGADPTQPVSDMLTARVEDPLPPCPSEASSRPRENGPPRTSERPNPDYLISDEGLAPARVPAPAPATISLSAGVGTLSPAPAISERRNFIGSADIPMVVGVSPFGGPLRVYRLKKFPLEERPDGDEPEHLWIGRLIEPAIAEMCRAKHLPGDEIAKPERIVHPTEPWAAASPDFFSDSGVNIECKNVSRWGAEHWPEDAPEPPLAIVAQVTWQVGIARAAGHPIEYTLVGRLFSGCSFRAFRVDWFPDLFERLLDRGRLFWARVQAGDPPALDDPDEARDYLRARFPRATGEMLPPPDEAHDLAAEYQAATAAEKEAQARKDAARNALCAMIGDADGLAGLCTWKNNANGPTAWKRVAELLAERLAMLAAEFDGLAREHTTRPGPRVFRPITERKGSKR